jgi:uncharacterized protein (TIGR00106 family)
VVWSAARLTRAEMREARARVRFPAGVLEGLTASVPDAAGEAVHRGQAAHINGSKGTPMIVAFSVTPIGVGEDVGAAVAEAVRVVRASGLPNQTDAMFTLLEGEWDQVMSVVKQAADAVLANAPRVSISLKADIRPGVTDAIRAKVASIEAHLAADEIR